MNHLIRVTTEVELAHEDEVRDLITRCAQQVLKSEGIDFDAFIDVTIVDGETIRQMNAEYRDKDAVTDVLSFPMYDFYNGEAQEELEYDPEIDKVMLGDMILNYDRAVEQAADFGHSPERECGFLTVHSVLHLLGYDHEREEDDRLLMRGKEEKKVTVELGSDEELQNQQQDDSATDTGNGGITDEQLRQYLEELLGQQGQGQGYGQGY